MKVKFWGVRGSIPTPGQGTVRYGGNTSCVSVDLGDDIIVFDAGTGLRLLGNELMGRPKGTRIHLFLSHVHWDHIQGFPFFAPAYNPGFEIVVYGRGQADLTLGQILAGQMEGPNFPVALDQLEANLKYRDISIGQTILLKDSLGSPKATVTGIGGHHPNGVLVYRLEDALTGKSMVYATDTEHYSGRLDKGIVALAKGADLLIYDGMYTPEEYENKHRGWGHSTWDQGLAIAAESGVKRYVIFHHDPGHDDDFLDALQTTARLSAAQSLPGLQVDFAREGLSLDLSA